MVRARLLTAAAQETVERGLAAITLEAVARRAGVSKGGLLHHFPSRTALIKALYQEILDGLDRRVKGLSAQDPEPRGRFTRAYLKACLDMALNSQEGRLLAAASLAMSLDDSLSEMWRTWLDGRLESSGENPASVKGRLVRFAADGLWLDTLNGTTRGDLGEIEPVLDELISLTYEIERNI